MTETPAYVQADYNVADRGEALASTFEGTLALEMLESQALRALALGAAFAVASAFVLIASIFLYEFFGWRTAFVPLTVVCVIAGVSIFEFGTHRVIRRHIARGTVLSRRVHYATACVEITAMSALIVFIQQGVTDPVFSLSTPPLLGYCLIVILSTLNLDSRQSLFTGALAALQYLAIVLYTFSAYGPPLEQDKIFLTPAIYVAKALLLLLSGVGAAFVARELSRRQSASLKAVEERNREHRANTMKSQFLADMSHEIRTPLNAVIGYAQLLETDSSITAEQRKAVDAIRVGGRHLLAVVNDVLDISKIEAGSAAVASARFNLKTLLQELTLIFAARCNEKHIAWIFDMSADAGDVVGDEAKLRQVLTNLLGNAVKFTDKGHVALRVSADGDNYRFTVEDTGPGVSEDRQKQIFDPFAQEMTSPGTGGTGLGLAIAQRYVTLMGGEITLESKPGAGARFRFGLHLPRWTGEEHPAETEPPWEAFCLASGQIVRALVADDVAANRAVLSGLLERAGVTVSQAENGQEALEVIGREPVDIAFLDIRMPDMPGTDVVRRLKEEGRDGIKLVAVSASALTHQQAEYLAAGFDDVLSKPVQMAGLRDCMAHLLGVGFETVQHAETGQGDAHAASAPALPEPLWQALTEAARRHGVTDLRHRISELAALGPAESAFAARLKDLCGRYDMTGVLSALEECRHD